VILLALPPQSDYRFVDLFRKFAGRGDHESPYMPAPPLHQAMENGDGKCRRFPRSGLGQAHDVPTGHNHRDCFRLDRCGGFVADRPDPGGNNRMECKIFKFQKNSFSADAVHVVTARKNPGTNSPRVLNFQLVNHTTILQSKGKK